MLTRQYLLAGVLAIASMLANVGAALTPDCGKVSIASMSWASANVMAEIDKLILSAGYGCDAQLAAGDTVPTFASMRETGQPDLVPELWVNAVGEQLDAAVASGDIIVGAEILTDGGEEGWWIPRYVADAHPEIITVSDALDRPDLFLASDDEALGAVYSCPPGWGCQISMSNLFRAHDAEAKGFKLVNAGTAAELDASIARAHASSLGWLGYYWAPTAMLGRFEMVRLQAGEHDKQHWDSCTVVVDCENPVTNAWPPSRVFTVFTNGFVQRAEVAVDYVSTRQWSNMTLNSLLAWMDDNQATGNEAALYFLENYEDIWASWVPADVRSRVKAAL